jgi:phosphoglucosamine mutase
LQELVKREGPRPRGRIRRRRRPHARCRRHGDVVDGDQIVALLALHLHVPSVVVTPMTNLGFHELMSQHGIETHVTEEVGDRYVLETIRATDGKLGGRAVGSRHLPGRARHGDGLVPRCCCAARSRDGTLAEAAAVMPRHPRSRRSARALEDTAAGLVDEVARHNEELAGRGRVLVRPSGTEPVVRVLAEARDEVEAASLCASIATLVRRELG